MMEKFNVTTIKLAQAIGGVAKYNGLDETIKEWKDLILASKEDYVECLLNNFELTLEGAYDFGQLQAIWMILVQLYGNYGTSPRYGWIENKQGAAAFIDIILKE